MKKFLFTWGVCVLAIIGLLAYQGLYTPEKIGTAEALQNSGDKLVSISSVSTPARDLWDGSDQPMHAAAVAYDNNAQFVVYYVNATGADGRDTLDIYERHPTSYMTLSTAYCGGTTGNLEVSDQRWNELSTTSGLSFVVIDDGAGTCGWAELRKEDVGTEAHYADGGGVLSLIAGTSNLALGDQQANDMGQADLSGSTFSAGSRVYLMKKVSEINLGAANVSRESDKGIYAITKGSPGLFILDAANSIGTSGAGTTIQVITGGYES